MVGVTAADIDRMTDALFSDGDDRRRKLTKFWTLLPLAAVIASAGIVSDSTATVIGAMIVAPLMTPILGTAQAVVLADRRNLIRSVILVLTGALSVVLIGYVLGVFSPAPVLAATNPQVAGRVDPHLVDLIAALATGLVGAFALVRPDVSDTLPGVAIAISLVPPLAVVGLTLESGAPSQAAGALLLFGTNVAAIIAMGTAVFLGYRIRGTAETSGYPVGHLSRSTLAVVALLVVAVAIPLGFSGYQVRRQDHITAVATPIAQAWAIRGGWQITSVEYENGGLLITAAGVPPAVDPTALSQELSAAGLTNLALDIQFFDGGIRHLVTGP